MESKTSADSATRDAEKKDTATEGPNQQDSLENETASPLLNCSPSDSIFSSPSKMCIARIHTDLKALKLDPLDGIFVQPDETLVNVCHAIIVGPSDTPYEFGFFYFLLEFPDQYPCVPPRVTLKTTGGGQVRFNPNLYACGKVCLSILGTWHGPSWSPAQNIGSLLLSIQSLMSSSPFFNEPGFEDASPQQARAYNQIIRHETIRVAILEMVDLATKGNYLPDRLATIVRNSFMDFSEVYKYTCDEYAFLDGKVYVDPFWPTNKGVFQFLKMKERIEEEVEHNKLPPSDSLETTSSSSSTAENS